MALPSGLPEIIDGGEDIARFLTQSSHYSSNGAKAIAFLPNKESVETSVSRHGHKPTERLWELGLEAAGTRNLHGAAIFKASLIAEAMLSLTADEPPDRHAAIRGWPINEDLELQKAAQKRSALIISSKSDFLPFRSN